MDELELTEFQKLIAEFIQHRPPPGKHCARNAIRHIQTAWTIRLVDPEMSVFRCLTAVEESTTAIFHSLKRHHYEGAEKLNHRSHVHKAALRPFLSAIETNFANSKLEPFAPTLRVEGTGKEGRILLRFIVPEGPQGPGYVFLDPPLHFSLARNGAKYHFKEELDWIVNKHNANSILDHVEELANRRNKLLYASQHGIPQVAELLDNFLLKERDTVFQHLCIYMMIDPYSRKQLFAQQTLESFLKMLKKLPDDL